MHDELIIVQSVEQVNRKCSEVNIKKCQTGTYLQMIR